MSEYFCISFLFGKKQQNTNNAKKFFYEKLGLSEEKFVEDSEFSLLSQKHIITYAVDSEKDNYFEFVLGISNLHFKEHIFEKQIQEIYCFVDYCFGEQKNILYALCGYEIDASCLLGNFHDWKRIDYAALRNIPIVFVNKNIELRGPLLHKLPHVHCFINHDAQDLVSIL